MKITKITISESGQVRIPSKVSMRSFEVAELFGVFEQAINANVREIIKSGIIIPDTSGGAIIGRGEAIPLDLGLDMITALAFRIKSRKAEQFREWVLEKISETTTRQPARVYVQFPINNFPS